MVNMNKNPQHCDDVMLCCNCASNVDCAFYQYLQEQLGKSPEDETWNIDWDKVAAQADAEAAKYEWHHCRKKPVIVEYRSAIPGEVIRTVEGLLCTMDTDHYVMRGVHGELYPITKSIFDETHEPMEQAPCVGCDKEDTCLAHCKRFEAWYYSKADTSKIIIKHECEPCTNYLPDEEGHCAVNGSANRDDCDQYSCPIHGTEFVNRAVRNGMIWVCEKCLQQKQGESN